jgi:predicted nucleic acid-binding protein
MIAEAHDKGLITQPRYALLSKHPTIIPMLIEYWRQTDKILRQNMLFLSSDEAILRNAQVERDNCQLFTNDSMIISCMREYGISSLASFDGDFAATGMNVFEPDDV